MLTVKSCGSSKACIMGRCGWGCLVSELVLLLGTGAMQSLSQWHHSCMWYWIQHCKYSEMQLSGIFESLSARFCFPRYRWQSLWCWVLACTKMYYNFFCVCEYWPPGLLHHNITALFFFSLSFCGSSFRHCSPKISWTIKARCSVFILSMFIITYSCFSSEKHVKLIDSIPFYCAWCV